MHVEVIRVPGNQDAGYQGSGEQDRRQKILNPDARMS